MNTRLLDTSYQLELLRSLLQGLPCIFVVRLVGAILLHAAAAASTRARLRPCGPHGRPLAQAGPHYLLQTLEPRFNLATVLGRSLSSSSMSAMLIMVVVIDEVVGGGDGAGIRDVISNARGKDAGMIMMFLASSDPVFQSESMRSPQRSANGTSFWPTSSPTADVVHCAATSWPFPWPPFS